MTSQISRASRSNPIYARRASWAAWRTQIGALIGSPSSSIASSQFAEAVANWQRTNGIRPADGMLGPQTWSQMASSIPGASASVSNQSGNALRLVSRDSTYLVFNRDAFRNEVVEFLWGGGFSPTRNELHSRSDVHESGGLELELPDTHWALAQTAFASSPDLHRRLRREVVGQLNQLTDESLRRPPRPPRWVPQSTWTAFLASSDGVHAYPRSSPFGTTIILVKRRGISGYAEAPTQESTIQRILNSSNNAEEHVPHFVIETNRKFNVFMRKSVNGGMHAGAAYRRYGETVQTQMALAFLSLMGFGGGGGSLFGS